MFANNYETADEAFYDLYHKVNSQSTSPNGTRKIHNVGIKIMQPTRNRIFTEERKWSPKYAEREWQWYLSENRSVAEIKKYAPIWDRMHSGDNIVNSNYGWQWGRCGQLEHVIEMLQELPLSRQAWITIHDGKEWKEYEHDTPCTLSVGFMVENGLLCMSVLMRSNDLWFGFCNDQYCFSKLQIYVAKELKLDIGWYYHYAADMHLYKGEFNKF